MSNPYYTAVAGKTRIPDQPLFLVLHESPWWSVQQIDQLKDLPNRIKH